MYTRYVRKYLGREVRNCPGGQLLVSEPDLQRHDVMLILEDLVSWRFAQPPFLCAYPLCPLITLPRYASPWPAWLRVNRLLNNSLTQDLYITYIHTPTFYEYFVCFVYQHCQVGMMDAAAFRHQSIMNIRVPVTTMVTANRETYLGRAG